MLLSRYDCSNQITESTMNVCFLAHRQRYHQWTTCLVSFCLQRNSCQLIASGIPLAHIQTDHQTNDLTKCCLARESTTESHEVCHSWLER